MILLAVSGPTVFDWNFLIKLKTFHDDLKDNVPYQEDITSLINARNTRGEADRLIVEELLENWPKTDEEIAQIKKRTLENPIYRNLLISEEGSITAIMIKTQTYSSIGNDIDVLEGFDDDSTEDSRGIDDTDERKFLTDEENSKAVSAVHANPKKYEAPDFQVHTTGSASVTHFIKRSMMKDMRRFLLLALIAIILFLYII